MTESSRAVFLSYASQDSEPARRLCAALRAAGIEVWIDQSELRGGDVWDQKIRREIQDCALFIPIISHNTQNRLEGYFRLEWDLADQRTHRMAHTRTFILPVCVDATSEQDADVPVSFQRAQWTRLPNGEPSPLFVARVADLLNRGSAAGAAPADSKIPHDEASQLPARRRRIPWAFPGALGVIVILGAGWLAERHYWTGVKSTESTASQRSIAVLPFADMSEKDDQEYFGDGMADDIRHLLAKVPGLLVIGRTSSFQFKQTGEDPRTIGEKLHAAHLLEGSVRHSGDQIRITAALINVRTGAQEWSETYDRQIGDVLKLQSTISAAIARELQLNLTSPYLDSHAFPKDAHVYDLLLRGRHALDQGGEQGLDEAIALFQQALDSDAHSAAAAAALAVAYAIQGEWGSSPGNAFEQARQMAERALSQDPHSAVAHDALARIALDYDRNWIVAGREFKRVADLAPGDPGALVGEAMVSRTLGHWEEALRQIRMALAADPLNPDAYLVLAKIQWCRGYLQEAQAAMSRVLQIRPATTWVHFYLGTILLARGEATDALREMQEETDTAAQLGGLAMAYHALGRHSDSDAALARLVNERADTDALQIAGVYAFRRQPDDAMQWLEKAYKQKDNLALVKVELPLRSLYADARFKAFLRKLNLPE